MAKITSSSEEKVFKISKWLGLNENPDGDTRLKLGEAAVMRNFKITRDGSLQKRPGLGSLGSVANVYELTYTGETSGVAVSAESGLSVFEYIYVNPASGEVTHGPEVTIYPESFAENDVVNQYVRQFGTSYVKVRSAHENPNAMNPYYFLLEYVAISNTPLQSPVRHLWSGYIGGRQAVIGVSGNHLVEIHNGEEFGFRLLGRFTGDDDKTTMFGFQDKLYLVFEGEFDGAKYPAYYVWDGSDHEAEGTFGEVYGYDPVVAVSISPSSGTTPFGNLLERVNLLSSYRRAWLSPVASKNQADATFYLPEVGNVISVKSLVTGSRITDYKTSQTTVNGTSVTALTFSTETTLLEENAGINTIEVYYSVPGQVLGLQGLFPEGGQISAEQYNGTTDNRIFLCCDKSNKVYYSGLDYNGQPRADYFPDLNVISVGESSDTVTGMIRHYSRLIVYKANSTYSIQYGTIGLADGTTTAAFYCTPVNKRIGNEAFGQVRLVLNSPRTLHGRDLYEWRNNSSYSSNLTVDERQAKRISDRIYQTLASFDFSKCYCYDDNDHQEYYICYNKKALVHNYAVDAWYYYDNFDVTCMVNFGGELYAGDSQGRFNLVSRTNRTDNGEEIKAYWESGAEAFGKEWMRKYSSVLWVTLKPENRSHVVVTAVTDRNGNLAEEELTAPLPEMSVSASLSTFVDADFRAWSFGTSRVPKISRAKIKAKKFVYHKLLFKAEGTNTTATIVSAEIKVRYTGQAR